MTDQFTQTTTASYGGRITNSLKGFVIGIIIFIISFGVLYWNEGRVDISVIAKTAIEIDAQTQNTDSSLNGKLISTTGNINSDKNIGDDLFVRPDKFIAIKRKVEMYAWNEEKEESSDTNFGGSETTNTTYRYILNWTEDPTPSDNFEYPKNHKNPKKTLSNSKNIIDVATIGIYKFSPKDISLPDFSGLPLDPQNINLSQGAILKEGMYLFIQKSDGGTFESPKLGDLRVSYTVLYPDFYGTIFGRLDGNKIEAYFDKNNNKLYRIFEEDREQSISTLHSEYTMSLWITRLVGFLLMWIGLSLLFMPLSVLMDVIPIFGTISRITTYLLTFATATFLTIITIFISIILHSIIALIVFLFAMIGILVISTTILKKQKKDKLKM